MSSIAKLALTLFFINLFSLPALSSEDLSSIEQCIPENTTEVEIAAKYVSDDVTYLYVGGQFPRADRQEYSTTLISVRNNQCDILISNDDFSTRFFDVVDYDIEKALWIENYKLSMSQVGGLKQLQELLDNINNSDIVTERSIAEVDALEELGIKVPNFYNLISNDSETSTLLAVFLKSQEVLTPKFVNNIRYIEDYATAEWYTRDPSNGLLIAERQDDSWQVIGHTVQQNDVPTPEQLNSEFAVPLDIANQLLEAE